MRRSPGDSHFNSHATDTLPLIIVFSYYSGFGLVGCNGIAYVDSGIACNETPDLLSACAALACIATSGGPSGEEVSMIVDLVSRVIPSYPESHGFWRRSVHAN